MTNNVNLDFLTNAKALLGELRQVNAYLHNIQLETERMNTRAVAGHQKHGNALKGLALRFVGYQLVLGQVMNAQRKLYEYVVEGVNKFREFETRLAEVATIMTGDYQGAVASMKSGIESLSLAYGQATSDLTKGLYDIMSAAFSTKDAMNLLNTATKASIAGLSDVRTSVDIFTTVLNTYGMSVYEATKVSDILFQSVVRGKFQFQELESALGYVVPIASQAGIAFEELMAALSTTTRHGLHLDMAARGLAMALQNIINPSEQAKKAAEKYQIELSGLALRVKGIAGVFGEMNAKAKEYGKIVLNELIPNIRSLRVAMVLAGDEGLEGLLDDMDRLSVAAGRTEEALNKIKDTSQFTSSQITQQWEKTQREVGEAWDKFALGVQRTLTDVLPAALNWKTYVPVLNIITALQDGLAEVDRQNKKLAIIEEYTGMRAATKADKEKYGQNVQWVKTRELTEQDRMKIYLDLQTRIAETGQAYIESLAEGASNAEDLKNELDTLTVLSASLQDNFNRTFGEPILGGLRNLEEMKLTLEEITFDTEKLEEELTKPIEYGWAAGGQPTGVIEGTLRFKKAQLLAEQELKDVQYDVNMGLEDADYIYKVLNADMQEAVRIVREHKKALDEDREATNLLNEEMKQLQIKMLELQLVGMMRRRGLTRAEERLMKQYQIEQAKLRLENMKQQVSKQKIDESLYEEKKGMIDDYIRDLEHESYMLKYNYDQQITDLDNTIKYEEGLLDDRTEQWKTMSYDIQALSKDLMTQLAKIYSDPELTAAFSALDINIKDLYDTAKETYDNVTRELTGTTAPVTQEDQFKRIYGLMTTNQPNNYITTRMEEYMAKQGLSFQRGTEYVPETGLALVHRGEHISPDGREAIGGVSIDKVNIYVSQIAELNDIEKLGALLSVAKNSNIIGKDGKSKYRVR